MNIRQSSPLLSRVFSSRARHTPTLVLQRDQAFLWKASCLNSGPSGVFVPNGNRIVLKLEHMPTTSPTGSLYDRLYPWLFELAENTGRVIPTETHVVECSVGNAGAAFAHAARTRGYKHYTVILPSDIYSSRIEHVRALGANIVFSPELIGPRGYIEILENMVRDRYRHRVPGKRRVREFCPISKIRRVPIIPYAMLVEEVRLALRSMGFADRIDAFTCVVGAGNTVSLIGQYLRQLNPIVQIAVAEHAENPFVKLHLSDKTPPLDTIWSEPDWPATTIHGVPLKKLNLDLNVIDDVVLVCREERDESLETLNGCLRLGAGRPSGTCFHAALRLAERLEHRTILIPVFDSIVKYRDSWTPIAEYDLPVKSSSQMAACHV